jgi:hypothetical protein
MRSEVFRKGITRCAGNESEGDGMNSKPSTHSQEHVDLVFLFALQSLSAREMTSVEAQILSCEDCRQELETLLPIVRSFVGWSTDVFRPAESLWGRLAKRIATEAGTQPFVPALEAPAKPEWEEAAPGIHVKILARNAEIDSVSMLVRLDAGTDYPAHRHAGTEELHLLYGILKVDDRTLYPGDFIHSEAASIIAYGVKPGVPAFC